MNPFRVIRRRPRPRWTAALTALAAVAALAMPAAPTAAAAAAPKPAPPPAANPGPAVSGVVAGTFHFAKTPDQANRQYTPTRTAWPAAATASVALAAPAARSGALGADARAVGTPVSAQAVAGKDGYAGPRSLDVRVLSHDAAQAAGVDGALFSIAPPGGPSGSGTVQIALDYNAFAQAYGGNFASRLSLVQLPACALTTPAVAACRVRTALASTNNTASGTVSAQVSIGAAANSVVLAATTAQGQNGGPAGSYAATSLKPSGTWSEGGSTGAFTYSYPISVPPASSSLIPQLALSYNSANVDGQTASTQTQASWAGDGWSTGDAFIEQSFISCSDNPEGSASPSATDDQCYDGPILTLSMDGTSTPLVCNAAETSCQAADDTGEVIKHVTGSNNGSGTHDTDYWTITERNGSVFQFGRNELPGWAAGDPVTNSVASMPVFSAHSGDPCYNSAGFSSSVCTMAYRWNLDYATNVHGDAMAYYYKADTNFYGQDNGAKNVSYIRDTFLDHIDYGFTDGHAFGTVPDKVAFGTGDRCMSGTCDPLNSADKANWPDVPFDLVCASGATCQAWGPSFFSTVRLTTITAEQYSTAASSYKTVDSYALKETMPATGDGTSPTLWLSSITHTGSDTAAGGSSAPITLPPVSFTGIDLANRVDTVTDGLPPLYRFRIATITTETGSVISTTYGQPKPCTAPVTTTPSTNTNSCYPVYWTPQGYTAPFLDWFNSYVVNSVTQTDPTGGAPPLKTSYEYQGGAAWHFDDNEVVKAKYRTYGQLRGYGDVRVRTGDGVSDKQTLAETTYYRGMSNDNTTTAVNLTDSAGGTHEDLNQLAGMPLEATSYLGDGGPVDHSTITSYWVSAAAQTRTRTGLPDLTATWTAVAETYTRQALTGGGSTTWRYTETDTSYDAATGDADFGLATHSYTHTVPVNAAYDTCETTLYAAANASANLVGQVAGSETDSVACGGFTEGSPASAPTSLNSLTAPASVNRPAQVVSATRAFYDDPGFATTFPQSAAPTKGDVTMTQKASNYTGGAFTYQTTARSTYDAHGRPLTIYDANGNKTTTAYTMNSVGLTTATTVTNALNQATAATLDPERALTLTSTDPNGVVTTEQYDALGRATSVWLDSRSAPSTANYQFTYQVSNSGLTAVTTQKLHESGVETSVEIYDAALRPRQTQTMTPAGGRLVTDTFYDTRGWTDHTFTGWWDSNPDNTPSTTLATASDLAGQAPVEDYYTYDGLGRTVIDDSENGGALVSVTTTVYNGDRTTVIPPSGGVVKTTATDPLGRTSELDEYTTAPTVNAPANTFTGIYSVTGGTTNATAYGYDGHGNQATITTAGRTFTSTYNLLGQVTAKSDPDAGTSSMLYDPNGNPVQSTDARGKTISLTYDALNRKTGEYDAPTASQSSANQLASWAYDDSNGAVSGMTYPIGHLTTETAYSNGAAYTTQQSGFNIFGESLGETVTIPSTEGALAGSYTFQHVYTTQVGLPLKDIYPAAGGLPQESVLHQYATQLDLPTLVNGLVGYGAGDTYDAWGRVNQQTIGNSSGLTDITRTYDPHTGLLTNQTVSNRATPPTPIDSETYTHDPAGNITSQTTTRLGATAGSETQCYAYDQLDRLSTAWTATDNCATRPTQGNFAMVGDNLGASSAYWTTWGFDALGNRTAQTDHTTGSGGQDTTTGYTYNGGGANQPDTLTSTAATGSSTPTATYAYDADGNMTTRNAGDGQQTLTWDDAGRLTTITSSTNGTSSYVYDADGNLLLQKDSGTNTLYLPGEQLTLNTTTQSVSGIRYYTLPGGDTAYRTGAGNNYGFEVTDQQGTSLLSLDYTAQVPTWRQQTPYGAPRGQSAAWVDNRSFLNKPADPSTGLDIVGARDYDPTTGRFISIDPLLEATSPQELGGYTYGADNPITNADPTGLHPCGDTCGGPGSGTAPGTGPSSPGGWQCGCGNGKPPTHSGGGGSGGGGNGGGWGGGGNGGGNWGIGGGCNVIICTHRSAPPSWLIPPSKQHWVPNNGPAIHNPCYTTPGPRGGLETRCDGSSPPPSGGDPNHAIAHVFDIFRHGAASFWDSINNPTNNAINGFLDYAWNHVYFQISVCFIACLSVTGQHGVAWWTVSGANFSDSTTSVWAKLVGADGPWPIPAAFAGASVGVTTATADQAEQSNVLIGGGKAAAGWGGGAGVMAYAPPGDRGLPTEYYPYTDLSMGGGWQFTIGGDRTGWLP